MAPLQFERLRFGAAVRGFAAKLDATDLAHIRGDKRVAEVVPDRPVRATALVPMLAGDNIPAGVRRAGAAVDGTVREASRVRLTISSKYNPFLARRALILSPSGRTRPDRSGRFGPILRFPCTQRSWTFGI